VTAPTSPDGSPTSVTVDGGPRHSSRTGASASAVVAGAPPPARGLRGALARIWRSRKWRLVLLVFAACKVAAPLLVFLTWAMLGRAAPEAHIPAAAGFSVFDMWFQWDSVHYLRLATEFNFFTPLTPDEQALMAQSLAGEHFSVPWSLHRFAFAPLYPMLAKLLSIPLFGNVGLAILVVSNLAFFACLALIYDLAGLVLPKAKPGDAVILLALAPTGFLLQAALTESTFLALALGCFVLAERRRWGWVVPLAAALALTRSMGFMIALPLLFVLLRQRGWRFAREDVRRYAGALPALAAAPLAWGGFMAYCRVMTGDWFAYTHVQWSGWWVSLQSPVRWVPPLLGPPDQEFVKAWLVLAAVALLALAIRRVPVPYVVWGALLLVTPLAAGLWAQSILRYLVVIFTVALLGAWVFMRWPRLRGLVWGALAVVQALLLITWQLTWTYMIV